MCFNLYVWLLSLLYVAVMILCGLILSLLGEKNEENRIRTFANDSKTSLKRNKWHKITLVMYLLSFVLVLIYHHYSINTILFWTIPFVVIAFLWNSFLTVSSYFNPIYICPENRSIKEFRTAVVIPVYNEDRELFKKVLNSLSLQTSLPDYVYVIEDGSLEENKCEDLFNEWKDRFPNSTKYIYKENAGKREAQAVAFNELKDLVDNFITIDSDTILNVDAIEQGLYPFFDEEIMSVGGALLDYNNSDNFLTRSVGVSFVSAFSSEIPTLDS